MPRREVFCAEHRLGVSMVLKEIRLAIIGDTPRDDRSERRSNANRDIQI